METEKQQNPSKGFEREMSALLGQRVLTRQATDHPQI